MSTRNGGSPPVDDDRTSGSSKDWNRVSRSSCVETANAGKVGRSSWPRIFRKAGFDAKLVAQLISAARRNGTTIHEELSSTGRINEERFYRALASHLGLAYCDSINHEQLVIRDEDLIPALTSPLGPKFVLHRSLDENNELLVSPRYFDLAAMRHFMTKYPSISSRIRIVSPRNLRAALLRRAQPFLGKRATSKLFDHHPHLSARIVANASQGFGLGLFAALLAISLVFYPSCAIALLHCLFSLGFLFCILLRLGAAMHARPPKMDSNVLHNPGDLPVYSVLVPLYKEADVIPDLLIALGRIIWPRSKLEIKLLLEEDDQETKQALELHDLRPNVEILTVPNLGPRTKPKALTYAMPILSGKFVVVYDAEDVPHPAQLLEAWRMFQSSDDNLACLQAPLHIKNSNSNMLTRLFAFEYAALFRGLLLYLARKNLHFPLGGTSNHFRVSALTRVCDWDPFNVTEDADLAVRLSRFGYRMQMISNPTMEDAPENLMVWIKQRTRWFKGWMQTFLVHWRDPMRTIREMRLYPFVIFQILLFGMIVSSLSYALIIVVIISIFYKFANIGHISDFDLILLFVDFSNIVLGLSAFLFLGWKTLSSDERVGFWKVALATPAYWFAMSIAAWRAGWQLYHQPFLWEKTPHRRSSKSVRSKVKTASCQHRASQKPCR